MGISDNISIRNNKQTIWHIISFAGVLILLCIVRWNSFSAPFERDEGEYSYSAWLLQQKMMPYEHSFLQKPPMIVYTYLLGQVITGDSVLPPRIFAFLSIGLSTILIGLSIAKLYSKWAGHATMWFMTPMLAHPALAPFAANTEIFMILPLSVVLFIYAQTGEEAKNVHWIITGISSAVAVLFKPIAVFVLLFIFIIWLYQVWKSKRGSTTIVKSTSLVITAGMITTILALLPFLLHGSGRSLWECVVKYNYSYATADNTGSNPFVFFLTTFLKEWWILFILLVWFFIKRQNKWWIVAGIFVISLLSVYRAGSGHYYIMVIPFWAAIAAVAVEAIVRSFPHYFHEKSAIKKLGISIVVMVLLILPVHKQFFLSPEELVSLVYGSDRNPFLEARSVARHVSELSNPADYVFVAGSEPQILYHAQRRSSSRFVIMYPLMINTPFALNYHRETIASLKNNVPEIIVFVRSQNSWLMQRESPRVLIDYLNQLIKRDYRLAGGWNYETKEWYDMSDEKMTTKCSIVVYKKKSS